MPRILLLIALVPACLSTGPDTESSAVATRIAEGAGANFALTKDGAVRVWGASDESGIDTGGDTQQFQAPRTIPGLESGVADIQTYVDNACALMTDGTMKCWGTNASGQLGTGDHATVITPTEVSGISGATEIAVGGTLACALVGGGVKCMGANDSHQLGIGDPDEDTDAPPSSFTPVTVAGLETGVAHIRVGFDFGCAIMQAGALVCWGNNAFGNLGLGDGVDIVQPSLAGDPLQPTTALQGLRDIALGYGWSIAANASGQVQGFGNNIDENTLGLGPDAFGDVHTPTNLLKIPATATKVSDMCAIVDGGDVWCWSDAQADYTNDLSIPVKVEGLSNIVQVEGESTACALDSNGAVFCWGDGEAYEIGDGEFHGDRVVTPVPVLSFP